MPGTEGKRILDWAKKADSGPFSSLGILDRLVYPNYEALITLAAAAGVTQRIRLMTTVLLAPLRNPVLFAKQAASLDAVREGGAVDERAPEPGHESATPASRAEENGQAKEGAATGRSAWT